MTQPVAVGPVQVSQELLQQIRESVLQKTVDGMKEEGNPYVGECSGACWKRSCLKGAGCGVAVSISA